MNGYQLLISVVLGVEVAKSKASVEKINMVLQYLNQREKKIICSRFRIGETGVGLKPFKEVARVCGLSIDSVREKFKVAILKLQYPSRRHMLLTAAGIPSEAPTLNEETNLDELEEIPTRTRNVLRTAHIQTLGELSKKSDRELLRLKNFGQKSLTDVKQLLERTGFVSAP